MSKWFCEYDVFVKANKQYWAVVGHADDFDAAYDKFRNCGESAPHAIRQLTPSGSASHRAWLDEYQRIKDEGKKEGKRR